MDACVDALAEPLVESPETLEQEFEQRLADSSTLAFRVALSVLRDRAEAEDVAQESFLRAYQSFHRLRDRTRFRGWLARIAWRLALDRIRARKRREQRELASLRPAAQASCEELAASSEFRQRLASAIAALPERLRMVLTLAAVEGHDLKEVARLLDLPEGTVKSRLHVARKRLLETLR